MAEEIENNEEIAGDESEEQSPGETDGTETVDEWTSSLLSPEGVVMMSVALAIDAVGIVLLCLALDDLGVTDILGMVTIGSWMFFRSGTIPDIKKQGKKTARRFALTSLGELVPYLGALPWWTIAVYQELTS